MRLEYGPMCKVDPAVLVEVMRRVEELIGKEAAPEGGAPKKVFSFAPEDVEGLCIKRAGEGPDLLFCLRDGRIFDTYGNLSAAPGAA